MAIVAAIFAWVAAGAGKPATDAARIAPRAYRWRARLFWAAIVGGIALAVSLGSRAYVANLIGAHHLRQAFGVGQRVRIGELEGTILELTAVSIVLETGQGRVNIPAKVFNEAPIVLLAPRSDDA